MAVKDMTFLRNAPLNSWLALNDEETEVLAAAPTFQELNAEIQAKGLQNIVLWKTPPSKGRLVL